jgi:hypothetical protein
LGPCEPSTRSDKLFKTAVHKALQSKEMIEGLKALFFFEESDDYFSSEKDDSAIII